MKKITFILLLILGSIATVNAQCPMCKTAVESGMEEGHTKGRGLNDGILYLLATPYLAIAFIGGAWYYKRNKKAE
ncbi:hypothetical protein OAP07_03900 [Bacteroidia bacterium]|jgi:hypothetical protein|nr:hypothetical protein [Bacteroidia bacterium]MDC0467789.1 hypothetical protein [Bacteroidia bacterium]MDC0561195.1 hypothetical protein [Bacteroidia bacterium]MDC3407089.1 hypothetical protein [Bacteroidia bacterium]CAI8188517.1 MAG: Uncharacterised protein [Bacteroidia bacterium]